MVSSSNTDNNPMKMTKCFKMSLNWILVLVGVMLPRVASYIEVSQPATTDVQLSVISSCLDSATLSWSCRKDEMEFKKCELTHYQTGQLKAEIIDIYPDTRNHHIQLPNLLVGQSYTAFLVCDGTEKTNKVRFIVGDLCEDGAGSNNMSITTTKNDGPSDIVQISRTDKVSTVGWISAIMFSFLGGILIIIVAYYAWRKYQHRQRILRIFRHEQNDPFQALYSPTQDSYSF